jgi:hypothetical protein
MKNVESINEKRNGKTQRSLNTYERIVLKLTLGKRDLGFRDGFNWRWIRSN